MPSYGVARVCAGLGLARSSYYHTPHGRTDGAAFERVLVTEAGRHPAEGARRLTARLRRRAA